MEKLTIQLSNGANRCALVSTDLCLQNKDCFSCPQYRKMVDRLAAYEDTELEPEQVLTEYKLTAEKILELQNQAYDVGVDSVLRNHFGIPWAEGTDLRQNIERLRELLAEEKQPNEPLGLAELEKLDAPVWCSCKTFEGEDGYWCLCRHGVITTPAGSQFQAKDIPHWVFLRRKPISTETGPAAPAEKE